MARLLEDYRVVNGLPLGEKILQLSCGGERVAGALQLQRERIAWKWIVRSTADELAQLPDAVHAPAL